MLFYSILFNASTEADTMLSSPLVPGVIDPNILKLKTDVDTGIYQY